MSDESDDPFDEVDVPLFPRMVRVAGAIWIVVGLLTALGSFALVVLVPEGGHLRPCSCCAVTPGCAAGVALLVAGLRICRGAPADTLPSAVGAIGLSLLSFLAAAELYFDLTDVTFSMSLTGLGATLLTASALVLGGRGQYLAWKADRDAPAADDSDPPGLG